MNTLLTKKKSESSRYGKLIDDIFLEEAKKGIIIKSDDSSDEIARIISDELIRSIKKGLTQQKSSKR